MSENENIAQSLVKVEGGGQRWLVTFGAGRDSYQLLYDRQEVAEHIAAALRALVIEGITRTVRWQANHAT